MESSNRHAVGQNNNSIDFLRLLTHDLPQATEWIVQTRHNADSVSNTTTTQSDIVVSQCLSHRTCTSELSLVMYVLLKLLFNKHVLQVQVDNDNNLVIVSLHLVFRSTSTFGQSWASVHCSVAAVYRSMTTEMDLLDCRNPDRPSSERRRNWASLQLIRLDLGRSDKTWIHLAGMRQFVRIHSCTFWTEMTTHKKYVWIIILF